jgi:rare lipoprotein A
MVMRLSAALCGVAMVVMLSAATAKPPATHAGAADAKKSTSAKSAQAAVPALDANGQPANPLAQHVFVSRRPPYLCAPRLRSFADRFAPAQLAISSSLIKKTNAEQFGVAIIGAASMYNPYRLGATEGGIETASGELYDPAAWTAAILTDLRGDFGGVHYGKEYRPAYALIESGGKRLVVRINDVGTLAPGRVIDLNQQAMHYLDPSLRRGLVRDIMVTPLPGQGWVPGPVERSGMQAAAAPQKQVASAY